MRQQHRIIYLLLIVAIQFSACKNRTAPKKDVTKRSTSKAEQPVRSAEKPSNEECRKQDEELRKKLEKIEEQAKKRVIESMRERKKKQIRKCEEAIRDGEEELKMHQEELKMQQDKLASIVEIEKEKRSRGEAITTEAVDKMKKIAKEIISLQEDIEIIYQCMDKIDTAKKEIENSLGHEEEEFEAYERKYSKKPS